MSALHLVVYAFGGAFLTNAVPHLVNALMGRPFPSPFADPPGRALSSPVVNVFWGFANLIASYLLIERVGRFALESAADAAALGIGMLVLSLLLARTFGKLLGGDAERAA